VLAADLGIADNILDVIRNLLQVAEAAADSYDILLDRHYGSSTNRMSVARTAALPLLISLSPPASPL
jgi:hypothetical protein